MRNAKWLSIRYVLCEEGVLRDNRYGVPYLPNYGMVGLILV